MMSLTENDDNAENRYAGRTKNMRIRDNGATCRKKRTRTSTRICKKKEKNKNKIEDFSHEEFHRSTETRHALKNSFLIRQKKLSLESCAMTKAMTSKILLFMNFFS